MANPEATPPLAIGSASPSAQHSLSLFNVPLFGWVLVEPSRVTRLCDSAKLNQNLEMDPQGNAIPTQTAGNSDVPPGQQTTKNRLDEIKEQVNNVTAVVAENIDKLMERDFRLQSIKRRSEDLKAASETFHLTARKTQNRLWWQDVRWSIVAGVVGAIFFLVLLFFILKSTGTLPWN
ncbi:unnamed protein product [Caenorhabditis auriculariae]|uniref:V-SNARE coiled-coil homology domain-containing protein n=1 Tax=Caenorhabditis auriculariae TaxID=2777116 RepID=A0A8S1HJG6_9PELO|nr:unnamed protein product [Caenorhabditis auriculariae]